MFLALLVQKNACSDLNTPLPLRTKPLPLRTKLNLCMQRPEYTISVAAGQACSSGTPRGSVASNNFAQLMRCRTVSAGPRLCRHRTTRLCQYSYVCSSKASKLSSDVRCRTESPGPMRCRHHIYIYIYIYIIYIYYIYKYIYIYI
jgi:hypothetical protein